MSDERITPAMKQAMEWLSSHSAAEMGELGQRIGQMLAELTAELADARAEAAHWKAALETVRDEIKVLAAVAMKQQGNARLVITEAELRAMVGKELHVGTPEPGVRVYEIRERAAPAGGQKIEDAVHNIIRPH